MKEIIISEIRPFGNLESMLLTFEKEVILCEKEGYTKEVARLCKLLMEFGLLDYDWFDEIESEEDRPETEMIVIFSWVLLIRLNNIALNNISMDSIPKQLMSDKNFMKYFPSTIFK